MFLGGKISKGEQHRALQVSVLLLSCSPCLASTAENVLCQGCPVRGREKFLNRYALCACARCVPVVSDQLRWSERNSKNFRSLDKVQMNGRYALSSRPCTCVPMRAKLEAVRMGGVKRVSRPMPTERSEACARAGDGLVGEADNKGSHTEPSE